MQNGVSLACHTAATVIEENRHSENDYNTSTVRNDVDRVYRKCPITQTFSNEGFTYVTSQVQAV